MACDEEQIAGMVLLISVLGMVSAKALTLHDNRIRLHHRYIGGWKEIKSVLGFSQSPKSLKSNCCLYHQLSNLSIFSMISIYSHDPK